MAMVRCRSASVSGTSFEQRPEVPADLLHRRGELGGEAVVPFRSLPDPLHDDPALPGEFGLKGEIGKEFLPVDALCAIDQHPEIVAAEQLAAGQDIDLLKDGKGGVAQRHAPI